MRKFQKPRFAGPHALVRAMSLATALAASADSAQANSIVTDVNVSPCTGARCSSRSIDGELLPWLGGPQSVLKGDSWAATVRAGLNECLRLEVLKQENMDLEMTVISPDFQVYQNNDKGGAVCPNCPLIKISGTKNGYYVIHISSNLGWAGPAKFRISIGRYTPRDNPNCRNPTLPK